MPAFQMGVCLTGIRVLHVEHHPERLAALHLGDHRVRDAQQREHGAGEFQRADRGLVAAEVHFLRGGGKSEGEAGEGGSDRAARPDWETAVVEPLA